MTLPYAEEVNYWKSGTASPDSLLDQAQKLVKEVGGTVVQKGIIWQAGRSAVVLVWTVGEDGYRIAWPVLTTKSGNTDDPAARRQAAAFVLHDVKAKCMVAKVLGARTAFAGNLLLSDNRTVAELTNQDIERRASRLLPPPPSDD